MKFLKRRQREKYGRRKRRLDNVLEKNKIGSSLKVIDWNLFIVMVLN